VQTHRRQVEHQILVLEWIDGSGQIKLGWITGDPLPYFVRETAFEVLDRMKARESKKLTFGPKGNLVSNEPYTP
jgi:hypothetical protein